MAATHSSQLLSKRVRIIDALLLRELMARFPGFLQLQAGLLDEATGLGRSERWRALAQDDLRRVREYNGWHADVRQLSASLPFYGMRHLVRPGLTGWAQVKYGYAGDEDDALEKLQYEFFYLRHQSLRFDLRVMARTVRSVTGTEGKGR